RAETHTRSLHDALPIYAPLPAKYFTEGDAHRGVGLALEQGSQQFDGGIDTKIGAQGADRIDRPLRPAEIDNDVVTEGRGGARVLDRKSTRLNCSHLGIS